MAQFLQKDLNALEDKIKIITQRLREVILDGAESVRQSSETWHDNFGFEESSRQQKMLGKQLEELQEIFQSAVLVQPRESSDTVAIGSRIKLLNVATGGEKEFLVGSFMVLDKKDDLEVAYTAPIVTPFFGAHVEIHEVSIGENTIRYELVEII